MLSNETFAELTPGFFADDKWNTMKLVIILNDFEFAKKITHWFAPISNKHLTSKQWWEVDSLSSRQLNLQYRWSIIVVRRVGKVRVDESILSSRESSSVPDCWRYYCKAITQYKMMEELKSFLYTHTHSWLWPKSERKMRYLKRSIRRSHQKKV